MVGKDKKSNKAQYDSYCQDGKKLKNNSRFPGLL
jgi:hypothetical protein